MLKENCTAPGRVLISAHTEPEYLSSSGKKKRYLGDTDVAKGAGVQPAEFFISHVYTYVRTHTNARTHMYKR